MNQPISSYNKQISAIVNSDKVTASTSTCDTPTQHITTNDVGWTLQGELVDRVENHVQQGRDFTENAKKELYTASVYASKARKVRIALNPSYSLNETLSQSRGVKS